MKVAFIGHRKIEASEVLKERLTKTVEGLIINERADTFLFGSKSDFDNLCLRVVTELKEKYPHIRRVFVRVEYENIDKAYTEYLLTSYEETFFPVQVKGAGRLSYVRRNQAMIDMCDVLVAYCDENYKPIETKSGTKIAVDYAKKKSKPIINLK